MNIKAIIASLVLGSSSVAMAAPSVTLSASAHSGYRAPVAQAPVVKVGYRPGWQRPSSRPVTLAAGMHFAGDGRTSVTVGSQAGVFGSLQISAAGGRTFIKQVYVQFDNGQEQVIRNLDRTLTGNETLSLDLDGNRRAIRRVVVYGNEINSGWRRADGAFTLTAA